MAQTRNRTPIKKQVTAKKRVTTKKKVAAKVTAKKSGSRAKRPKRKKARQSKGSPTQRTAKSKASARASSDTGRAGKQRRIDLHLVSESTGSLALHMISVAMSQFPKLEYKLHSHPFCSGTENLPEIRQAILADNSPLVVSALAQTHLKKSLAKWCERREIHHYDLTEPVVAFVSASTGHRPIRDASITHRCDDRYFKRMDAWEFTLQHDDSRRLETIGQADLILLGVSRVGKTPLSAYLGSLGYRVANVSIARETKVPSQIVANREKTVGLTVDPEKLAEIRKRRFERNQFKPVLRRFQGEDHTYYSERTVLDDVVFAEREFHKLGIHTLDMTKLTVEESAAKILQLLGLDDELA